MKVTITYRSKDTNRTRTVKDVKYLGSAHAKAITLAIPGTINYPVPTGFRLKTNKAGNSVFRPIDKRGKKGKYEASIVAAAKATKEELKNKVFTATCYLYTEVPKERRRRTATYIKYDGAWFQIADDEPYKLAARMKDLDTFTSRTEHDNDTFDGRPAWTFWNDPDDYPTVEFLFDYGVGVESETTKDTIRQYITSGSILVVVYKSDLKKWQTLDTLQPEFFSSALDVPAGRDQPMLNTSLIEYHIRRSDTLVGLFPPEVEGPENGCLFTLIWNVLQKDERFQDRNKTLYAEIKADPYRWMWNLCFPNRPYTGTFEKTTVRQALPVFDALGKEVKVFDATSQLWAYHIPPAIKQSDAKVVCMLYHNEHVYLCNRSHKTAHYTDSQKYDVTSGTVLDRWLKPSTEVSTPRTSSFPLPRLPQTIEAEEEVTADTRFDAPPMYISGYDVGDQIARIVSKPKSDEEYTHYQFYVGMSIKDIHNDIYEAAKYETGVAASSNKIWGGLNITNWVRRGVRLNIRIRPIPTLLRPPIYSTEEESGIEAAESLLQDYIEADKVAKMAILSPNVLSQYSSTTLAWYKHGKRGGRSGHLISEDEYNRMDQLKRFLGLDVAKHYTHILCSFQKLQVVSFFDEPLPYDGHELDDYNTYEVFFPGESYTYQQYSLCLGSSLKAFPEMEYKVISYIRPSRLSDNHIPAIIQNLWSSDLHEDLKKIISNTMSGTLGMDHGKSFYSRLFTDKKEAAHHLGFLKKTTHALKHTFTTTESDLNTGIVKQKEVWTLVESDRSDYHSGFLPLYHMCIDGSQRFLYQLQKEIEAVGLRPIKRHCDNIFLDVDYQDSDAVKEVFMKLGHRMCFVEEDPEADHGIRFITNKYDMFGRLKPDPKKIGKAYSPIDKTQNEAFQHTPLPPRQILTCDEWDEDAMFEILDEHPYLRISADDAGSGKTCLAVNYIKRWENAARLPSVARNLKVLVLSYQNDKVASLRQDFEDYEFVENITISTLDSFFTFKQEGQAAAYARLEEFDLVMVDEIDMTPIPTLTKLMRAKEQGRIKRMIITGDVHQLDAINNYINNIDSQEEYYNRIKDKYFPIELRLKEIKRARCPRHQVDYDLPTIRDCPECQATRTTAKNIYRSIRDAPSDEAAKQFVLSTFKQVDRLEQVENENLITYHVDTRDSLNNFCHGRVLKEKELELGLCYYPGMKLVCSKRHDLKDGTIHRNYVVEFVRFIGMEAVVYEPFEAREYTFKVTTLDSHYRRSHAVTCHSKQGASIKGNTYIFDLGSPCITKKWLYVAVSRNTSIWNNFIYVGDEIKQLRIERMDAKIQHMIDSHRRADIKAGRPFREEDYVTVADVRTMIWRTKFCSFCQGDVDFRHFSIDRIDSELAHVRGNCQLLCSSKCNSAKRKNFEVVN